MALKQTTLDNGIGLIEPKGNLTGGDETVELRQAVAGFLERATSTARSSSATSCWSSSAATRWAGSAPARRSSST